MFSERFKSYVEEQFQKRLALFGDMEQEIISTIENIEENRALLLKFFYGTMPVRDAGEYAPDVFLSYVDHGLWLREQLPWCRDLPEDLFLHYVLYYRVNTEGITPCREFFYRELAERIRGKSITEAVLEVNYWCAEQAGYEASDSRTLSPMGVYQSGSGRCGEESAFTVSVLRSVGIPARQVYAPWWSHCDDNHAWVEVYVEGTWHFLGACEPEEVLDRGWFLGASSRALLVHSRTFFDYWLPKNRLEEEYIGREGSVCYYNSTARYAGTRYFQIQVLDLAGNPVSHAQVSVEVLNMAEYGQLASLLTDGEGRAGLILGLGSIHIHARKDGWFGEADCSTAEKEQVDVRLQCCEAGFQENGNLLTETGFWQNGELLMEAPKESRRKRIPLTEEQRLQGRKRRKAALERRKEKLAGRGFPEIDKFLSKDDNPNRKNILRGISRKDHRDVTADTLECFLDQPVQKEIPEDIFIDYVLCPRIWDEELVPYPPFVRSYFSREQKEIFMVDPGRIWNYIEKQIRRDDAETYPALSSTPVGCLRLGQGTAMSRKILFVAVCRSLGIPARICPTDREAEFWRDGRFWQVTTARRCAKGCLHLSAADGAEWSYHQNWSLGRLTGTQFETLDYGGITFGQHGVSLELAEGIYRLIITSRLPNGDQHARVLVFPVEAGKDREIFLSRFHEKLSDLLCQVEIEDFAVTVLSDGNERLPRCASGVECSLSALAAGQDNFLAFLEVGQEPTEHVLNEMLASREQLSVLPFQIQFLLRNAKDLEHPTLRKVLKELPKIRVLLDPGFEHAEPVARAMYVDPEKLPLLVALRQGMTGVYGCSGYNVGSVELMIKLLS